MSGGVLAGAVSSVPLSTVGGQSGSPLQRVTMADGRVFIVKEVDTSLDWIMQATHDEGRVADLHQRGVFDDLPAGVDSTIVAVEPSGDGWRLVMRDATAALLPDGLVLSRDLSKRFLSVAAAIHSAFAGTEPMDLCSLADLYGFLSPKAAVEHGADHLVPRLVLDGWDRFPELVPADVGDAVLKILDDPASLAQRVEAFPATLVHGDLKIANLGLADDGVVILLDWGALTSWAPPAVDFAWYLAINAASIDATHDELLEDVRRASIAGPDDPALPLAL